MGLRVSGSKLSLVKACAYPFRSDVDVAPEPEVGRPAHTGIGFALLREHAVEPGRFEARPEVSQQARLDVLYEGGKERAERLIERWLKWWGGYQERRPGLRWESEIPFAFDPTTGKARRLKISAHRAYEGAKSHEFVGTADMIGTSASSIIVLDEKTGRPENVTPAVDNQQLKFLSMCHSLVEGPRVGHVGLVFPHVEVPLDEALIDGISIDAAKREFMALPARIASAKPTIGDWCKFCPHRSACPAWRQADDIFGAGRPPRAVSSPPMARIRTKTPAADVVQPSDLATDGGDQGAEPEVPPTPPPVVEVVEDEVALGGRAVRVTRTKIKPGVILFQAAPEQPVAPPDPEPEPRRATQRIRTADDFMMMGSRPLEDRDVPKLHEDFERIVERIYKVDALKEYDRLEKALKVGERRTDRGALNQALDEAEDNARLAHALFLASMLEAANWKSDAEIIMAPIRHVAVAELEKEKKTRTRTKDITEVDVRAKMAITNPDEFKWHAAHAAKISGMELQLKKLADLWSSRCASLRIMLDKVR